jgi:hypothetical protein
MDKDYAKSPQNIHRWTERNEGPVGLATFSLLKLVSEFDGVQISWDSNPICSVARCGWWKGAAYENCPLRSDFPRRVTD